MPTFTAERERSWMSGSPGAFWVIAVDVEIANRSWHQNSISHDPSAPQKGDFSGQFHGPVLLLTKSGLLCTATASGLFAKTGDLNNRKMDISFTEVGVNLSQLQWSDWGWGNSGRWREDPRSNIKVYGLQLTSQSIRFTESQRPGTNQNSDGKGTSAALSKFVKSGGAIFWPRHFETFDY